MPSITHKGSRSKPLLRHAAVRETWAWHLSWSTHIRFLGFSSWFTIKEKIMNATVLSKPGSNGEG
jgi:hypothetical protein